MGSGENLVHGRTAQYRVEGRITVDFGHVTAQLRYMMDMIAQLMAQTTRKLEHAMKIRVQVSKVNKERKHYNISIMHRS